jgi:hypothetical protein
MLSEKQILSKSDMSLATVKISRKANLASAETAWFKADSETAYADLGLWDLEKKKEQFLTIDRF